MRSFFAAPHESGPGPKANTTPPRSNVALIALPLTVLTQGCSCCRVPSSIPIGELIASAALRYRLPTVCAHRFYIESGVTG